MQWNKEYYSIKWSQEISHYEEKLEIAKKLAGLVKDGDVISFGSGSTSFLAVQEIAKRVQEEKLNITALPTSNEIRNCCMVLGIPVATLNDAKPDWGFDGADEVDPNGWLIKGRGGAMFNEKLLMCNSQLTYILVDSSKFVDKLCTNFAIPVECVPSAQITVIDKLTKLGGKDITLRLAGKSKDGPVITENGNIILDVHFDNISESLEKDIKSIVGVVESGLFIGYNIKVLGK